MYNHFVIGILTAITPRKRTHKIIKRTQFFYYYYYYYYSPVVPMFIGFSVNPVGG